ncbi:MAG TPA: dephospho-CoA kinase [Clostridiales bacterium]|nr:dephospho-CoA kinase [Clostridiales bacterium]
MNSLDGVMVVGLTGQTGAGKTTVCGAFESNGFTVINADLIAREVMRKGLPCLVELADCFSEKILTDNGELDRKYLSSIVFNDKCKLEQLNSICYPYITSEILNQIKNNSDDGKKLILLDAPTLFESRADDFCELIISVVAKQEIRLERIMKRDGLSESEAKNRIDSQLDEAFFKQNSDFIIKNNKGLDNLSAVAKEVSDKIKDYYNNKLI